MQSQSYVVDVSEDSFEREVIQESHRRPVLVDFWAEWCGPCKALAPILSRAVEALEGRVRLAKVDTEAHQGLAMDHRIRSLPTVRLYRDGTPVAEFLGARPDAEVREFIERHAALGPLGPLAPARECLQRGDLSGARERVEAHLTGQPDDMEARILLAEVTLAEGDAAAAREIVDGLPALTRQEKPVAALSARITFASARGEPDPAAADEPLERRFQAALRAIADGAVEDGMHGLLDIMSEDRGFRDDGARKALLDAFLMLPEDDPRVGEFRGRMFSLLH